MRRTEHHSETARPVARLTATDLINLRVETAAAPSRVGGVAVFAGHPLRTPDGQLRLAAIRGILDRRLDNAPRLRQVIHRAGPLAGRPVWVDDASFSIDRHVNEMRLPTGGTLPELALELIRRPFTSTHPMWRIWFVTGLPDRQVGLVFAMHHVVADGGATLRMLTALMDPGEEEEAPVASARWAARPAPRWPALVRDNARLTVSRLRGVRRLPGTLAGQWRTLRQTRRGARLSLNHPVRGRQQVATVTVELSAVTQLAHRHRGTVNDVILTLIAGGVRALLRSRSQPTDPVTLHVGVLAAPRTASAPDQAATGNLAGAIVVPVPLHPEPYHRLWAVARASARAKQRQLPAAGNTALALLARFGLLCHFSRHQRIVHTVESNLAGPSSPVSLLGAPMLSVVPIGTLAGNLSLAFLALSYAGQLTVTVQSDADQYPDLPVLTDAIRRELRDLRMAAAEA